MSTIELIHGDCLEVMRDMEDNSVDLLITSPPYGKKRRYQELNFSLTGQDWVDWCVERWIECDRICKGLVAWVVDGGTKNFQWDATPALLAADLHRRGVRLRKPPIFHRVGIPGSGGNDWWRSDYELIICSSKGKLPWSDNTANGNPCRYGPGGAMSHRIPSGLRVGDRFLKSCTQGGISETGEIVRVVRRQYKIPEKANAGNVIKCSVGGGKMGSKYAHDNEAPFPMELIDPFVKCFCPPDGTVLDCFMGSGTSIEVARSNGRNAIGIDCRESQVLLTKRRLGIE